jgi:hypothetical protein
VNIADALAPSRRRGIELLDDPSADPALATRSLQDVARSNRWFGGASAVIAELVPVLALARDQREPLTLLDVGTGAGDIPELARRVAERAGVRLFTVGLEVTPAPRRAVRAAAARSPATRSRFRSRITAWISSRAHRCCIISRRPTPRD